MRNLQDYWDIRSCADSVRKAPGLRFRQRRFMAAGRLKTKLGQCSILARLFRTPYRWYAWVNTFADTPKENVVKLISSANEPSKNRCGASPHAPNQRNPRPHHRQLPRNKPSVRARYLIVDGHSAIFGWPEMQQLHARRSSLARDALVKKLRDYQDYTGVRVVVVFDGKGKSATEQSEPNSVQVFYLRTGQTADAILVRMESELARQIDSAVSDF